MENKSIIITLLIAIVIVTGCDKHVECKTENINKIYFEGFNTLKINKIYFEDLKDQTNNLEYLDPKFDSTDIGLKELKINQLTSNSIKNGFIITINDSLKYKITHVKIGEVYMEKKTMWNTKLYNCALKEYKINDSLINTYEIIVITK